MIMSQILMVATFRAFLWSSKFWNSLTILQIAAVVSAFILTIGAVIEYWYKLKMLAFLTIKFLSGRSRSFERCTLRKLAIHSLGPILVVLGIAGEVVFEGRAFIVEDRQEEQAQGKLRQLQILALARHVDNPEALTETLKPFKDRPVLLRSYLGDAEGWLLCVSLLDAVQKAHMDATDQCGKWPFDAGKPVTGLDISGPDSSEIADAIVLKGRTTHGAVAESGPAPLLIFVGIKNPFWLPEKALAATAQ